MLRGRLDFEVRPRPSHRNLQRMGWGLPRERSRRRKLLQQALSGTEGFRRGQICRRFRVQRLDDRLASWSKHKIIPQERGRTLLASVNRTPSSMDMVQVTTWNDYEEGTAVEPGVDNCGSLQITVSGDELKLQPVFEQNGTEDTVNEYDVCIARAGSTQLAQLAKGLRLLGKVLVGGRPL
jgi:hypothetical protein